MDEKYYCLIKNGFIEEGFSVESIHSIEKCEEIMANGGICIDYELHQYCTSLIGKIAVNEEGLQEYMDTATMHMNDGNFTYIPSYDEFIFGIEVKDCFTIEVEPVDTTPQPPTELELLKEEVLEQSEYMVEMDYRLINLELGL